MPVNILSTNSTYDETLLATQLTQILPQLSVDWAAWDRAHLYCTCRPVSAEGQDFSVSCPVHEQVAAVLNSEPDPDIWRGITTT